MSKEGQKLVRFHCQNQTPAYCADRLIPLSLVSFWFVGKPPWNFDNLENQTISGVLIGRWVNFDINFDSRLQYSFYSKCIDCNFVGEQKMVLCGRLKRTIEHNFFSKFIINNSILFLLVILHRPKIFFDWLKSMICDEMVNLI